MKKKIMSIIAIVAFGAMLGYNISISQKSKVLSNLTLANIEALANGGEGGEGGGYSCSASANCYFGDRVEGSISCSGKKACTSGYEFVECDGRTSYCS